MDNKYRGIHRVMGLSIVGQVAVFGCSSDESQGDDSNQPNGAGGVLSGAGGLAAGAPGASGAFASGGAAGLGSGGIGTVGTGGSAGGGAPAAGGSTAAGGGGSEVGGMGGMTVEGSGGSMTGGEGGGGNDGACTRENLKAMTEQYFEALSAQDSSMLPLAPSVKFTENGEVLEVGEGLWANAGETKFTMTLLDTEICSSVTQSVVADGSTDIPLGLRLKIENQQITEIEHIAVRDGDYFVDSNTDVMMEIDAAAWEAIEPADSRWTREQLEGWINKYFKSFPQGGCDLASGCRRLENGFSLACSVGASCSPGDPPTEGVMNPRLIVVDTEANMAAGFVMFQNQYTDFHMIKVKGGEIIGVYTILGEADGSGWD